MQPQNEPRREMVSWDEVDRLIDHLLPQFEREFTAMVIITRGGIVPGGMLALSGLNSSSFRQTINCEAGQRLSSTMSGVQGVRSQP